MPNLAKFRHFRTSAERPGPGDPPAAAARVEPENKFIIYIIL